MTSTIGPKGPRFQGRDREAIPREMVRPEDRADRKGWEAQTAFRPREGERKLLEILSEQRPLPVHENDRVRVSVPDHPGNLGRKEKNPKEIE